MIKAKAMQSHGDKPLFRTEFSFTLGLRETEITYVNDFPWKMIGGAIAANMQKPMWNCNKKMSLTQKESMNNLEGCLNLMR